VGHARGVEQRAHVVGNWRAHLHARSRRRMREAELLRVQQAARRRQLRQPRVAVRELAVAHERVTEVRQVHADLVVTSGLERAAQQAPAVRGVQQLVVRHGGAAASVDARRLALVVDRQLDARALRLRTSEHEREVVLGHGMLAERVLERRAVAVGRATQQQRAAGLAVETVHRRDGASRGAQLVEHAAALRVGVAHREQTRGLVDHEQVLVFEQDASGEVGVARHAHSGGGERPG